MTLPVVPCLTCIHFHGEDTCEAFPDKIPDSILVQGKNLHLEPVNGDHGIQYTPKET